MIKFNDVSLINNYKMINQEDFFIKLNFTFEEGKMYLIKGDKSIYFLSKLIMNFIEPTFGTINVLDFELKRNRYIRDIKELRKNIACLPYDYEEKFNYKTVNNIFKESLYNYNYNTDKDDELVEDIINNTGCYLDYKTEKLQNLDSITRYKLYLASLLIMNPKIIIIEKYINDDKIKSYLEYLVYKEKKTVIFVGNYNLKVDKVYVIKDGKGEEEK